MSTTERFWLCYCFLVSLVALGADGGGAENHLPVRFVCLHLVVASLQVVPLVVQRRYGDTFARVARTALALVGLPVVFSALCWILPDAHPEPYHLAWYRLDLQWFGGDVTASLRRHTPDLVCLVLQLLYASFYLLPIAASLLCLRERGPAAFDRALAIVVGGFLSSYLGYLWFPTLGPKDVLPIVLPPTYELAHAVRQLLDEAEANPWDCFPSGHTMMSLVSVVLVHRSGSRYRLPFAVVAALIVLSTMVLRYHWPIDVVAGMVAVPLWMRACDRLLDRDGTASA